MTRLIFSYSTPFRVGTHVLILLVAFLHCGKGDRGNSLPYARFILPESNRRHLSLVLEAFKMLGIQEYPGRGMIEGDRWDIAEQSESWDICWSWKYTQFAKLKLLDSHHRINHLPGSFVLVNKDIVYKTMVELQGIHGHSEFNFIPQQFSLPQDKDRFIRAYREQENTESSHSRHANARAADDANYGKRWLIKSQGHRGVRFFTGISEVESILTTKDMIAKCIEPFLIGGHKFDIGLYVAITSIDPLRIYVYDNVVMRLCKKPYPKQLDGNADKESYVVADYAAPWENEALKKFYEQLPSMSHDGTNHLQVLKQYMDENGFNSDEFERGLFSSVVKMIAGSRHKFLNSFERHRQDNPSGSFLPQQFFEMLRFDFVVDDHGKAWLMEVNQSPNLREKNFPGGMTDLRMKRGIVHNLLNMVTVGNSPFPQRVVSHPDPSFCREYCARATADTMSCWSCPDWFTSPEEQQMLNRFVLEYSNRGKYRLLFPETEHHSPGESSSETPLHTFLSPKSSLDLALQKYLSSASLESLTSRILCTEKSHCHFHGECVNGKCQCDTGFDGRTCDKPMNQSLGGTAQEGLILFDVASRWPLLIVLAFLGTLLYRFVQQWQRLTRKKLKY